MCNHNSVGVNLEQKILELMWKIKNFNNKKEKK